MMNLQLTQEKDPHLLLSNNDHYLILVTCRSHFTTKHMRIEALGKEMTE